MTVCNIFQYTHEFISEPKNIKGKVKLLKNWCGQRACAVAGSFDNHVRTGIAYATVSGGFTRVTLIVVNKFKVLLLATIFPKL